MAIKQRGVKKPAKPKKRKLKITFAPNPETMLIDYRETDKVLAELVKNPRLYRKTEEEMPR